MTSDQYKKCLAVAYWAEPSTAGFSNNSGHSQITSLNLWRWWYEYYILGEIHPNITTFCNVAFVDYLANLYLAQGAASDLSVGYETSDSSETVMDKILTVYGYPAISQ